MNTGSAIRHLAASRTGCCIAAAEFQDRVSIWDIHSGQKVGEFDARLDFGGERLAIDSDGQRIVAAAYTRYGVAAYDVGNGHELWRRKELVKVHYVAIGRNGTEAYCFPERGAAHVLDIRTGDTVRKIKGARWILESWFDDLIFIDRYRPQIQHTQKKTVHRIQPTTFAFLDAVFTRDALVTSESGGPVRLFRCCDGKEMWRTSFVGGSHCIRLGYHEEADQIMGVIMSYTAHDPSLLIHFDQENGQGEVICELAGIWGSEFCQRGTTLVVSDGRVFESLTGRCVIRFDFPVREYSNS